jgi:Mitochondrial carrier protein
MSSVLERELQNSSLLCAAVQKVFSSRLALSLQQRMRGSSIVFANLQLYTRLRELACKLSCTRAKPCTTAHCCCCCCVAAAFISSSAIIFADNMLHYVKCAHAQTQVATAGVVPYKGVIDCLRRSAKEEGVGALYKALVPRLASVVPMIGIQVRFYI